MAIGDRIELAKMSDVTNQIDTAKGSNINLPSTFNGGLLLKELQGKSVQNGVPSPTNKVDIVSVGDDGSVTVKVCGKNLLNINAMTKSSSVNSFSISNNTVTMIAKTGVQYAQLEYPLFLKAGTYTLSTKSVNVVGVDSFRGIGLYRVAYYDDDKVYRVFDLPREERTKTFTLNKDRRISIVIYAVGADKNTSDVTVTFEELMLEVGSDKTQYESYKGKDIKIPLTQPLRSVGSVCDRIIKKDGVWGVERNFVEKTVDKSNVTYVDNLTNVSRYRILLGDSVLHMTSEGKGLITDKLPIKDGYALDEPHAYVYNTSLFLFVPLNWFNTDGNYIKAVYQLATPTFEPFTQSIQEQLNQLQTYQGVTNIFTTDRLQPTLSVSYGSTDSSALALYTNALATTSTITTTIGTTFNGSNAPYTQTIPLTNIKSTDNPMISPVYNSTVSTALLQKKAWSCIDEIETKDGNIVVKCFKKKPTTSIPIQIKVVR